MAWAVSGLVTTLYAARFLSARRLLVLLTVASAGGALLTAMAGSFALLVVARVFAGAVSGPVLPLSQTLLGQTSLALRRGFSMGVVQSVGGSLGSPPLPVHRCWSPSPGATAGGSAVWRARRRCW